MNCEICGKSPRDGVTVFRVNPVGVPGIWRCRACLTSEQADALDLECIRLANIIDPPAPETFPKYAIDEKRKTTAGKDHHDPSAGR